MPSAAILAGGRASRFGGRDKSSLVVDGRTILERQIAELSRVTSDILVVGATPQAGNSTAYRPVPDRIPGCGPLAGLDAALAAALEDVVIVVACDMPFVTSALVERLVSLAGGYEAVVPRTDRGYHPLCAVYTRACRAAVARMLAEGRRSMMAVLEHLSVRIVFEEELRAFGDPGRLLANVNTPAEYQELEALQRHDR
jgi:molybdenum cofactor guanylyltransferase